ncbi:hypothetical protein UJ101_00271 [Flavobacteriaceae bacterium UJ101]|nr:hypothetical protein UJ101_00271 [Flavobacteriaceae bacterium UJ101]
MIHFTKHAGIYTLVSEQTLNIPIDKAWTFFSAPENLQKITPPHMKFQITSEVAANMYAGQIITYRVGILPGIKQNWVTEITQVQEKKFFIDEQRFGPYTMWHHEHFFYKQSDQTTLMRDKISYKIPFGFLGSVAQSMFIKKQLQNIFEYRYTVLETLFNKER